MPQRNPTRGYALAIVSAIAFGVMPILAVGAYAAGTSVQTVLFWRFALAALTLGPVALVLALRRGEHPPLRAVLTGLAMGGLLYAGQSASYFAAVQRASPALAALLLYTYPGLVALGAALLGRRRPSGAVIAALVIAFVGVALSLGPVAGVPPDAVLIGLCSAVLYTTYILIGARTGGAMSGLTTSTLVFGSAAFTFGVVSAVTGQLVVPAADARLPIVAIALACTVVGIWFFLESLRDIGATRASLTSTLEPVTTVLLGAVVVQTPMTPLQWVGAALVLFAAVLGIRSSAPSAAQPPG